MRLLYLQLRYFFLHFVFFTDGGETVSTKDQTQFAAGGEQQAKKAQAKFPDRGGTVSKKDQTDFP